VPMGTLLLRHIPRQLNVVRLWIDQEDILKAHIQ
jgi:hypothetical protein